MNHPFKGECWFYNYILAKNFSSIAAPLFEVTIVVDQHGKSVTITKRKSVTITKRKSEKQEIELNDRATEAFEKLKVCLTTTSEDEPEVGVLMMPNLNKPFIVNTDACNLGLGAVLSQEEEDKKCRPVAFYSKKLTKSELKYAIGEKELTAIVIGMEKFKIYLFDENL